jgi:hypothetical protein
VSSRQIPLTSTLGSVQVGRSETQSVTLTNVDTSSLIITQATPALASFVLTVSYPVFLYVDKSVSDEKSDREDATGAYQKRLRKVEKRHVNAERILAFARQHH